MMPIFAGLIVLVLIAVVAVAMTGDDKNDSGDGPPARVDKNAKPKVSANASNDFNKTSTSKKTSKKSNGKPTKAELKSDYAKVDMTLWHQVEKLYADARMMKADAMKLRESSEEAFAKKMGEAVRTWRKGDLLYEDWKYLVDAINEDLIDTWFRKQDKKVTTLTKQFRGWLKYEDKH